MSVRGAPPPQPYVAAAAPLTQISASWPASATGIFAYWRGAGYGRGWPRGCEGGEARGSSFRAAYGGASVGAREFVCYAMVSCGLAACCTASSSVRRDRKRLCRAGGVGFAPSASDEVASAAGSCRALPTSECAASSSSVHALPCPRGRHGAEACVAGIRVHATAAAANPVSKLTRSRQGDSAELRVFRARRICTL